MRLIATCVRLNRPVQPAQKLHPMINHNTPCGNYPVRVHFIFMQTRMFPTCRSIMESGKARLSESQKELLENAFQQGLVTKSDKFLAKHL